MEQGKPTKELGPGSDTQEFIVRIPKEKNKRFNIMRFNNSLKVDITKWRQQTVKMERENNYKEFKLEEDLPKFGAGSEFGRDLKDEARRKKHGILVKQYNPDDQPWILKIGGKNGKKFKGIREGGVTENASYYVFTQATDGTFEAHPVEEWYNFTPIQCFKALSAEEAEEEFGRRDKVLNYFSIMVKKRLQADAGEDDDEEEKKQGAKKKKKKAQKDFKISDMDEWTHDLDDESGESANEDEDENPKTSKKSSKKDGKKKKKKESKSDDEAMEESDEGDFDDKEVDYITSSSGSEEEIGEEEKANRELKGVEDEEALRKLMSDEEEEEVEEENKETEEANEVKEKPPEVKSKQKAKKSDETSGESSSESSDSDFDDPKFTSAIFVPQNAQKSKKKSNSDNSAGSSRANTPTKPVNDKDGQKAQKRKYPEPLSSSSKKPKLQNSIDVSSFNSTLDGINVDTVRRYLSRKPMTASELLRKFKNKKNKMNCDQLVNKITDVLKKIPLQKTNVKGKMYLSLKAI